MSEELVYDKSTNFKIFANNFSIFAEEDLPTIVEFEHNNEMIYYVVGNEPANLLTAVIAFEEFTNEKLTNEDLNLVMKENNLI